MRKKKIPGHRVGTKRRDMRWQDESGEVWDSRFEYEVYRGYKAAGLSIRRCTEADSIRYTRQVRNGVCRKCNSNSVVTEHTYTPDFFISADKADTRGGKAS